MATVPAFSPLACPRLPPALLGYAPVVQENGNLVYKKRLWIPADSITVGLYERLSMGAFSTPTPLGAASTWPTRSATGCGSDTWPANAANP